LIGSGGPGATSRSQLQGAQQPVNRGAGKPVPRGINRTTTGPAQGQGQQGGLVEGLIASKKAYDGGVKIRKAYDTSGGFEGLLGKAKDYMSGQHDKVQSGYDALNTAMTGKSSISPDQLVGGTSQMAQPVPGASVDPGIWGQASGAGAGSSWSAGGTGFTPSQMADGFQWGSGAPVTSGSMTAAQGTEQGLSGLEAATTDGVPGGGNTPYLAYAKIGYDAIDGGEQSRKLTGSTAADTVMRGVAAYYTAGFSELAYAFI
jgi:hypothetical protein